MKTVIALATAILSTAVMVAPAQAQAQAAQQPLTRAEVRADLALWTRAGLNQTSLYDTSSVEGADLQARLAQYHEWRYGAEFAAEVARQGERMTTARAGSAQKLN